jgi:hypothetical protein
MLKPLSVDMIFPVRDAPSAHFAIAKAGCLYAAGVIDERTLTLVTQNSNAALRKTYIGGAHSCSDTHPHGLIGMVPGRSKTVRFRTTSTGAARARLAQKRMHATEASLPYPNK